MARRFRSFRPVAQALAVIILAVLFASGRAIADPSPSPSPTPQAPGPAKPKPSPKPDEWTEARRLFQQLSPDQQQKFFDNLDQWKALSPQEQALFRDQELIRREKIAQEIQEAINRSGLHLDDDQREVYALRYTQERRKIEDTLRKETQAKRQTMVADMLVRLKQEFSAKTSAPTASPNASPADQ